MRPYVPRRGRLGPHPSLIFRETWSTKWIPTFAGMTGVWCVECQFLIFEFRVSNFDFRFSDF